MILQSQSLAPIGANSALVGGFKRRDGHRKFISSLFHTDALMTAGELILKIMAARVWSWEGMEFHINALEMVVVQVILNVFLPWNFGELLILMNSNATVVVI